MSLALFVNAPSSVFSFNRFALMVAVGIQVQAVGISKGILAKLNRHLFPIVRHRLDLRLASPLT